MTRIGPSKSNIVISDDRLGALRPALVQWVANVEEYVRVAKVPPYYYGSFERVNCGLLAAALWLKGMPVLQEFEAGRKQLDTPGRVDLHFHCRGVTHNAEVKMDWPDLGVSGERVTIAARIRSRLNIAEKGAKKYVLDRGEKRLALVFVVPEVPKKIWEDEAARERALREFVAAVRAKSNGAGFAAWCLPRGYARWDDCYGPRDGEYYYPAVALVGKVVGRAQ